MTDVTSARRRGASRWAIDLRPLRVPAYRRVWTGNAIAMFGFQFTAVAVPGGDRWDPHDPRTDPLCSILHCLKETGAVGDELRAPHNGPSSELAAQWVANPITGRSDGSVSACRMMDQRAAKVRLTALSRRTSPLTR